MNYPYDEVMEVFLNKHGLPPMEMTEEQWDEFEELMNDCMNEIAEQRSYTHPSASDLFEMNVRHRIEPIEREAAHEQKWRDDKIRELEQTILDQRRYIRELRDERMNR